MVPKHEKQFCNEGPREKRLAILLALQIRLIN